MAMNYEFERHIQVARNTGKHQGAELLRSLKTQFDIGVQLGIIPVLQRDNIVEKVVTVRRLSYFEGKIEILGEGQAQITRDGVVFDRNLSLPDSIGGPRGVFFNREAISHLLIDAHVTQKRLAIYLGSDKQSVSRWKRAVVNRMNWRSAVLIAYLFGQEISTMVPYKKESDFLERKMRQFGVNFLIE